MPHRPTIADLAQKAGVSVATVDRVLNGRHAVREQTAQLVYEAAQAIGFRATTLIRRRIEAEERPEITLGLVLQRPDQAFYQSFRAEAERAAALASGARVRLLTDFLPAQDPAETARRLTAMGNRAAAVALTSIDHHRVTEAVAELKSRGVPVIALLSDFAPGVRHSYIGIDNLRAGRTAAFQIAQTLRPTDDRPQVALLVGGHRWHGHELREAGFRSYFREHAPWVEVLDTLVTLEAPELSHETVLSLLARRARLAGIYSAGGGMEGTIRALREEAQGRRIAVVVNELTDESRPALADGLLSLVISTPLRQLCEALLSRLVPVALGRAVEDPTDLFLPMSLYLPESV
jgi:LacI family transcriptional regulator